MNEHTGAPDLPLEEHPDVVAALADLIDQPAPRGLGEAALRKAIARRAPGRPVDAVVPDSPADCFAKTSAELRALLASLTDDEWAATAHPVHGSVRDLTRHLVGIERMGAIWLDPGAAPAAPIDPDEHIEVADAVTTDLLRADPAELIAELGRAAERVLTVASTGDPARPVAGYGLSADVRGYLLIRTFELWAHSVDVSRATGRAESRLDPMRLRAMSTLLVQAIPAALLASGVAAPGRTARLVLTGPAGGAFSVPLAPGSAVGEPDVVLLTDPVSICLRAANRLAASDLPAEWEGDAALGEQMLAGLHAFAAD